jgi:hypothetical protein
VKIDIGSFVLGIFFAITVFISIGMTNKTAEVGRYMGWGDASRSRYMLDTTTGQLYLWYNKKGWEKQDSNIEPDRNS